MKRTRTIEEEPDLAIDAVLAILAPKGRPIFEWGHLATREGVLLLARGADG